MPNIEGSGNVFLTDDIIIKEALRLLKNNLIAARFVNRIPEKYFGKIGDTLSVKKPFRVKSASGRTLVRQPMVDQSVPFVVNNQEHVGLSFTTLDRTLTLDQFSERYLKSAVIQLAHKLDLSIWQCAVQSTFNATGVPGQGTTFETIIDAWAEASLLAHPADGMTKIGLNPRDAASHRKKLTTIQNDALVKSAIERAYLGQVSGMDLFETAQMPTHTVGVATGTPKVNGDNQTGSTLNTDGWTNSTAGILRKGDVFTIANVYSVNPQTYQSTGMLQQFVVVEDANSGASTGPSALKISPAINDGSLTTTDAEGNVVSLAAYQNVSAKPANDADITVLGTGGTSYRQNVMLHKDAISLAVIDMHLPESAPKKARMRDEDSGISLAMTAAYNINDQEEIYRLDLLWGVHNLYPELSRRVFGTNAA